MEAARSDMGELNDIVAAAREGDDEGRGTEWRRRNQDRVEASMRFDVMSN